MGTRSNIIVKDDNCIVKIYRHWDGYPSAVIPELKEALNYAWKLPRFEADEFAGAVVKAMKAEGGGHIRIQPTPDKDKEVDFDMGEEYVYVIKQTPDGVMLEIYNGDEEVYSKPLLIALEDKELVKE